MGRRKYDPEAFREKIIEIRVSENGRLIFVFKGAVDSFEVKEIVGEYGFVMKQFSQVKEEKGAMLAQAQYYRDEKVKTMTDETYC